jgi:hypothetical protein
LGKNEHGGKPIIVEVKNWESKIPITEIKKLVGDCKNRVASGTILVISKDASLNHNAYEYCLKKGIVILEVDTDNLSQSYKALELGVNFIKEKPSKPQIKVNKDGSIHASCLENAKKLIKNGDVYYKIEMVNDKLIIDKRCSAFKSIKAYEEYFFGNPSNYNHQKNHN